MIYHNENKITKTLFINSEIVKKTITILHKLFHSQVKGLLQYIHI